MKENQLSDLFCHDYHPWRSPFRIMNVMLKAWKWRMAATILRFKSTSIIELYEEQHGSLYYMYVYI
jgi:hypothetical protein